MVKESIAGGRHGWLPAASRKRIAVAGVGLVIAMMVTAGCSRPQYREYRDEGATYSPRIVARGEPVPKGGGRFKLGSPYRVGDRIYVPRHEPDYSKSGIASWYGDAFHGRLTANGEVFDMHRLSAAHPTLPLPSFVEVVNLETGRRLVLRVNDRGPFKPGRIIDVSQRAAAELGFLRQGTARVHVRYLGPAPL